MEGDLFASNAGWLIYISIHTLRVEGDHRLVANAFLPNPISIHTLRVEGDGVILALRDIAVQISIHTLRVEGDTA